MTRTLVLSLALLLCATGLFAAGGPDPNRYLVTYNDSAGAQNALRGLGARLELDLPQMDAAAWHIPAAAVNGLANHPAIAILEVDPPRYPLAQTVPYGIPMVQADQVAFGTGARTVCIIDSGYDLGHEDLPSGVSSSPGDPPSLAPLQDGFGHGTHVAGTVAALDNNVGVIGVAPGVDLHIVRVFGDDGNWAYASQLLDAAFRCRDDGGANVISMSLGCSGKRCSSGAEEAAFDDLYFNDDIINVAAAGNGGNKQESFPASYDSVISVAAIDADMVVADFSQTNSQVELAAPGVLVKSSLPMGQGSDESATVNTVNYEVIGMELSPTATGTGLLVDCGDGGSTCSGASGAVCLIQRGTFSFEEKNQACADGGGVASIIFNNAPGLFSGTLGNPGAIPSVAMSDTDGQFLLTNALGASATVVTGPGNYAFWDGTSMATPHVSGVAALVWSNDTSWTASQVRDALQQTALDLGDAGRDNEYGFGLVQAADALDFLQGGPPPPPPPTCAGLGESCQSDPCCPGLTCPGGKPSTRFCQ